MNYRDLGRTGVKVSELCLGTMLFGRTTSEEEAGRLMNHAVESGINFFDTANVYTANESERIIGRWLSAGSQRDDLIIATKAFFAQGEDRNARGLSRRHLIRACEDSLARLKTDYIDLYQMHRSQANIPIDETLRALDDLVRAGKVRYIGCSMFASWQMVESLWAAKELGLNRFVSEQPAYHLLDRTAEREMIPAAQSFGLAVLPWGPLCGGLLSGKYDRNDTSAEGRWQNGIDNHNRTANELAWDVIDLLKIMATEKDCSVSQLALAWVLQQPGVTSAIIGPRTYDQLTDNLGACAVSLTDQDFQRLDELAPPSSASIRYFDRANGLDFRPHYQRW